MKYVLKKLNQELSVTSIANLHFFEFPTNFYTEPDSHPFFELVFISSGKLLIESDNFNGVLDKNKILIHRPDELHSLKTVENNTPTVIIIGFNCYGGLIDDFSGKPVLLDDAEIKKLAEIVKEGRNVFAPPYDVPKYDMKKKTSPPYGAEQMLKNLLEYFLISLTRKLIGKPAGDEPTNNEKFSALELISYIDDNYKEKITIDELAFIFRTNRSTLCKVFKSNTNMTITEYIAVKKLEKAKKKILSTDKTFTEIAEELNFESIHYFTRFFKKHTGFSPNEFRKNQT